MLDWWSYIGVGGIAFQGLFLDVGLVGLILFSSLDPCYGALVSHGVSYCIPGCVPVYAKGTDCVRFWV